MNDNKFIIVRNDNNLHAQWDQKTIIFNSEDEARSFIDIFSQFFNNTDYSIIPETHSLDFIDYIFYKDIINTEEFIEELENSEGSLN